MFLSVWLPKLHLPAHRSSSEKGPIKNQID